jgi:hypothetical protein
MRVVPPRKKEVEEGALMIAKRYVGSWYRAT